MKRIGVTGGKGGTGKSTFAILLALGMSNSKKVVLCDCDAECPNDHIVLGKKLCRGKQVEVELPEVVEDKCTECGECSNVCTSGAVFFVEGEYPKFVHDLCNSCGACWLKCPEGAIKRVKKEIGQTYAAKVNRKMWLVTGVTNPGVEESVPVVEAARARAEELAREVGADCLIVDTAAGTHCNVMHALLRVDIAYAVTEPTPVGAHDLALILKALDAMNLKKRVVINRSDIGSAKDVRKIAKKFKARVALEIPYSKKVFQAYSESRLEDLPAKFLEGLKP